MKTPLYYIPADAHNRVLTMGIQYFVSLSEEKLANIFRPPMAQKEHYEPYFTMLCEQQAYDY
jgi:hypothetical protein